jgi:hypothetical protein
MAGCSTWGGRLQRLERFTRSKITLLEFIYTTCVDPEGCPLAYRAFDSLKTRIHATPDLTGKVRFVTVSFDPARDTPAVVMRYAGSAAEVQQYSGIAQVVERSGNKCWIHWRLACPTFLRQTFTEWAGATIPRSFYHIASNTRLRHRAGLTMSFRALGKMKSSGSSAVCGRNKLRPQIQCSTISRQQHKNREFTQLGNRLRDKDGRGTTST